MKINWNNKNMMCVSEVGERGFFEYDGELFQVMCNSESEDGINVYCINTGCKHTFDISENGAGMVLKVDIEINVN